LKFGVRRWSVNRWAGSTVAGVASRPTGSASPPLMLSSSAAGLVRASSHCPPAIREKLSTATGLYEFWRHVLLHQDGFPARKPAALLFFFEQMAQLNRKPECRPFALARSDPARSRPRLGPASIPVFLIGGEEDTGAASRHGTRFAELFEGASTGDYSRHGSSWCSLNMRRAYKPLGRRLLGREAAGSRCAGCFIYRDGFRAPKWSCQPVPPGARSNPPRHSNAGARACDTPYACVRTA